MKETRSLVSIQGETSVNIQVRINDEGDLVFEGQDLGKLPEEIFKDSDYEYWLTVKASEKDRVLLALIEKLYKGNELVITEFMKFLDDQGIESEFLSYA